jgi:hypothetical protein
MNPTCTEVTAMLEYDAVLIGRGDEHLKGACCFHLQGSPRRASCAEKYILCSVRAV